MIIRHPRFPARLAGESESEHAQHLVSDMHCTVMFCTVLYCNGMECNAMYEQPGERERQVRDDRQPRVGVRRRRELKLVVAAAVRRAARARREPCADGGPVELDRSIDQSIHTTRRRGDEATVTRS